MSSSLASAQEIEQEAHIRVLSKNLYSHGREPVSYGVLDLRMVGDILNRIVIVPGF